MENRLPAGLLHRLPAGPDMDAYAGIPAFHHGPAGRALPVERFRRLQLAVPGYTVGFRHPDRLFRSRLLRGRPQIPAALKIAFSPIRPGDRGNIVHSPGHFIYREHDFIPPGSCMKECMRNLPLSPFLHMLKPWNVQAVHPLFRKMNASTALKSPYLSLTLRSAKTFKGSSCLPEGLALI